MSDKSSNEPLTCRCQVEPRTEEEPPRPFDDPDFTRRLLEHMHRAKRKAIAEAREAGLLSDGRSSAEPGS
jgi:hypothetical protein